MKAIIIDDEQAMLMIMERYLQQIEEIEIAGSFQDAEDALSFIKQNSVEIAFIDIDINGDNGINLAKLIREIRPQLEIVFVTSHKEFALDSFEVYPLDYMVKPVSAKRLKETIHRAKSKITGSLSFSENWTANRIIVQALGSFEVRSLSKGRVKWISKKSQEIFAYLLMNRGKSVSKSRIVEEVFPDMPLPNARSYLNTAIYQLRKALSDHGMKSIIISGNEQCSLEMDAIEADFVAFEHGVQALKEITVNNVEDAMDLEKQYGGELFEDRAYMWSLPMRERLQELYEDLAKRLIDWLYSKQLLREAAHIAKKLIGLNEMDEESHFYLLRIYMKLNDNTAFLKHYKYVEGLFRRDLDVSIPQELIQENERLQRIHNQD